LKNTEECTRIRASAAMLDINRQVREVLQGGADFIESDSLSCGGCV